MESSWPADVAGVPVIALELTRGSEQCYVEWVGEVVVADEHDPLAVGCADNIQAANMKVGCVHLRRSPDGPPWLKPPPDAPIGPKAPQRRRVSGRNWMLHKENTGAAVIV